MAYVEVWKSGKLITRRKVDEEKARKGCKVQLGQFGEARVAIGESTTLGPFEVRMFTGDPADVQSDVKENISAQQSKVQAQPSLDFSIGGPSSDVGGKGMRPDIEGYKIIEPLGEGGMGMVWRAEQLSTKRQVALKVMATPRFASEKAQTRFEREVELTARLDQPNIARIYDSGLHHGMYYYAMELIDGMPLDRYVKTKGLSKNQILALMQKVCQGVLYAHLRAVIHRDLKPSNILVSADGQPHILDFGLAKALLEEDEALTISVEGQIAGTPAYMSPEQAAGRQNEIDTRTDVYSLGVILYELLMGQSPHDRSGSMIDLLQQITDGKIRRPREINKLIDTELEAIILKALARNPEERYASAGALAKDITNYLDEEPLDARVPTLLYFLRKKACKYRVQAAVILIVLLLVFGTMIGAYTKGIQTKTLREAMDRELDFSELSWGDLEMEVSGSDSKDALAALRVLRERYVTAQEEISQLNHQLGEKKPPVAVRRINLGLGPPMASTALVRKPSLPGGIDSWTLETCGHRSGITRLTFSPDSKTLASSDRNNTVRLWDAKSGQLIQILIDLNRITDLPWFAGRGSRDPFSWSVDTSAQTFNEIIPSWEINMPDTWQTYPWTVTAAALSPDRVLLAFGDHNGTIRVIDRQSGQPQYTWQASWCGPVQSVRFSPDSEVLATCAGLGTICLWDAHRWEPLRKFETDGITGSSASVVSSIAWAPDSTAIARANNKQHLIEILDSQSGELVRGLSAGTYDVTSVSWSPDGTLIAATTEGGPVHLWDLASGSYELLATLPAHYGGVNAIAWTHEDQSLITAGDDGKIEVWKPRSGTRTRSIEGYPAPITCLALSPQGNILAAGSENGIIRLWDAAGAWTSVLLRGEPNDVGAREARYTALAWTPDATQLASADSAGNIRIWDPKSRQVVRLFSSNCKSVSSLTWSPDGRVLLCGGADGTVRVWDTSRDYQEHVVLLSLWGSIGPGIAINANGDYRGPPDIADQLVYAVRTMDAQLTLSPSDFKSQYGWINEPWQVGLYEPGAEKVERIYVNATSEGPYDGKTWETAFSDLQDALSIAQPNTEIWVAAGTYTPDRGTGARTASFHLKNGVRLLGGFAGTETSSYQRDPNQRETILSGDLRGNDGPDFANNGENSYHVVVAVNISSNTVLDGFTVTGGNANGPEESEYWTGGGLYSRNSGLTVLNCTFAANSAKSHGGGAEHGWAQVLTTRVINCSFLNNVAGAGGGFCNIAASAEFTNCVFKRNGAGGGLYNQNAQMRVHRCVFSENTGGGICSDDHGVVLVADSTFTTNVANSGGGILIHGGKCTVANCQFSGNSVMGQGGGIHTGQGVVATVMNCGFFNNSCRLQGGGMVTGGGQVTVSNCVFVGNAAEDGGGGMFSWPDWQGKGGATLVNCSFVANTAPIPGKGAGFGAHVAGSTLVNCVLWRNTTPGPPTDSDQIYTGPTGSSDQVYGLAVRVDHCVVQGWTGKVVGIGNSGADPRFIDPNGPDGEIGTLDDNLRPGPGSPCCNAGDNSALPADAFDLDGDGDPNEPIPFDIDGKPRILNGTVDIGAYESN